MSMNAVGPRLNLGYHDVADTGYGVFGIELHKALERAGVVDYGPPNDMSLAYNTQSSGKQSRVAFYAATPPHVMGWYEGQLGVLFTMWEFSEIPAGFRENVPEFDRLLVPSMQNLEMFSRFNKDVHYVPLAAEDKWVYTPRKDPERYFEFLTGGAGNRKGNEDVCRAFNKVFAKWEPTWGPEPRLTIRTRRSLDNQNFQGDRIRVLTEKLTDEEYVKLFENSHCFVSGSKGEGWGLIPFQAIIQGMPTILGNAHGHSAFAHYGLPLNVHAVNAGMPTHWGSSGQHWVPDFDQMCEEMWEVYNHYDYYRVDAHFKALLCNEQFSWDKTAAAVIEAVPEMLEPDIVPGAWHKMPQRVYPVVVNHHETWSVNGRLTTFDPGNVYHRPWGDKVRLAEAGNLHPSCIDVNEMGILGDPQGGPDRCPHCNQLYGVDDSLYPENLLASV